MDAKSLYNMAYNKFTPDFISKQNIRKIDAYLLKNSESLIDFIDKYILQFNLTEKLSGTDWLELGCGLGSLASYIQDKKGHYYGMDFSELAISQAKLVNDIKEENAVFILEDITNKNVKIGRQFDFIIDSHLLHCLTKDIERKQYFEFIKSHLKPDGILLVETMCFDRNMSIPIGYEFCEDFTLKKEIQNQFYPIRAIKRAKDIEEEIQLSALKIKTFFYHAELGFNIYEEFPNFNTDHLPRTLRFSLGLA